MVCVDMDISANETEYIQLSISISFTSIQSLT
jgi:hypothetical protein